MLKQQVGILPHVRFDGIVLRRSAARHTLSLICAGLQGGQRVADEIQWSFITTKRGTGRMRRYIRLCQKK